MYSPLKDPLINLQSDEPLGEGVPWIYGDGGGGGGRGCKWGHKLKLKKILQS